MNLRNFRNNKSLRFIALISIVLIILYGILRIFIFKSDPLLPLFLSVYETYLYLAEKLAILIIEISGFDVSIVNHKITFNHNPDYQLAYEYILKDWTKYLLFKKWGAFLLFMIWAVISPVRKKIMFTGIFLLFHYISMVGGILILAVIAPSIFDIETENRLNATVFGFLLMFTFLVLWIKYNKSAIHKTLGKLKINSKILENKTRVIIVFLYVFYILNAIIIPFFSFGLYSFIITSLTEKMLILLNFEVFAEGIYLYGEFETLAILKSCLGLKTILLFAAVVYITGNNNKQRWVYILSGFIFLNIINITRLVVLFNYVQKHGDYRLDHFHDLYTYIVYAIVFILWIVWFEKYGGLGLRSQLQGLKLKS